MCQKEAILLEKGWMDGRMEKKEEGKDRDGWLAGWVNGVSD